MSGRRGKSPSRYAWRGRGRTRRCVKTTTSGGKTQCDISTSPKGKKNVGRGNLKRKEIEHAPEDDDVVSNPTLPSTGSASSDAEEEDDGALNDVETRRTNVALSRLPSCAEAVKVWFTKDAVSQDANATTSDLTATKRPRATPNGECRGGGTKSASRGCSSPNQSVERVLERLLFTFPETLMRYRNAGTIAVQQLLDDFSSKEARAFRKYADVRETDEGNNGAASSLLNEFLKRNAEDNDSYAKFQTILSTQFVEYAGQPISADRFDPVDVTVGKLGGMTSNNIKTAIGTLIGRDTTSQCVASLLEDKTWISRPTLKHNLSPSVSYLQVLRGYNTELSTVQKLGLNYNL